MKKATIFNFADLVNVLSIEQLVRITLYNYLHDHEMKTFWSQLSHFHKNGSRFNFFETMQTRYLMNHQSKSLVILYVDTDLPGL